MPTYINGCGSYEKTMKAMVKAVKKLYNIEGRTNKMDFREEMGRRTFFSTKDNSYTIRLWTMEDCAFRNGHGVLIDYTLYRMEDDHGIPLDPPN